MANNEEDMDKKPKFRVEGVPFSRNVRLYAQRIEAALNELAEEGYSVQVTERREGALIQGVLKSEQDEHPLIKLLRHGRLLDVPQEEDETGKSLSPRTKELLIRFMKRIPDATGPENFEKAAESSVKILTADYKLEELTQASKELMEEAETHEKMHPDHTCTFPPFLRAVAGAINKTVQMMVC